MSQPQIKLPITVLISVKNEDANIQNCLLSLKFAQRIIVIDSNSTDNTAKIAKSIGSEVIQFEYKGGYPKKRQWALDNVSITTPWILLLDADETIPDALWDEISLSIEADTDKDAFLITKGFHFLGRPMRYGGFSHSAIILFKTGKARFERIFDDDISSLDMEVHERILVDGVIGKLKTPLIHKDFKGLEAYISRHNKYSTWEAKLRYKYLLNGQYGIDTIKSKFIGNSQEVRRALKSFIIHVPLEHWIWFTYHYFFRLGFLEGREGLIACQIRASYISQVNAKVYELKKSFYKESINL